MKKDNYAKSSLTVTTPVHFAADAKPTIYIGALAKALEVFSQPSQDGRASVSKNTIVQRDLGVD